ncbi:Aldo/keto reductase [Daldinia caldariorum]|uniref:Aldo/keto reductase n=1 Tax=Daldinia caldariorum TaxID=326644 RepID=UPI0020076538|nr:Aldo/keto reductase [Daldinia caldariorum]KAI1470982.1 Aldo/keto reductase [Daldinia caldariorum]
MTPPKPIIGSGVWGHFLGEDEIRSQLNDAERLRILHIDSGAHHPYSKPGLAERLLGEIGYQNQGFTVDSKVLYSNGGDGTLTAEAVEKSIDQTLSSLKTHKINIYYALAPDRTTPLEEQAAAFDAQYRLGKFSQLGICNFQPDMLEEWIKIADEKGYIKPTVFQGQYNILCRGYEADLFPLLRKHGISFNAFGVLAGGMLTGKVTFSNGPDDLKGTRFEVSETNVIGIYGRKWYDKPCFHDAIRRMAELCDTYSVNITNAGLRWIMNHSRLDGGLGDGVIIGPRNKQQLDQYILGIQGGPLPKGLVEGLDSIWDKVKGDAVDMLVY